MKIYVIFLSFSRRTGSASYSWTDPVEDQTRAEHENYPAQIFDFKTLGWLFDQIIHILMVFRYFWVISGPFRSF